MMHWAREVVRRQFGVIAASNLKSWVADVFFKLLFLGAVLAGVWKTASGLIEGPNFYATRQVEVVESYRTWSRSIQGKESYSSPHIRYRYQNAAGETVEGKFHEREGDTPKAAKNTEPGDMIFLRVAVPSSDADARFGINQQLLEGGGILMTLLILWGHFRYRENPFGFWEWIQGFVVWNLMLWGWMWVAAP
ncbi:hypothetical protein MASR1M60_30250 [Rhodocyclaceae bacterium]